MAPTCGNCLNRYVLSAGLVGLLLQFVPRQDKGYSTELSVPATLQKRLTSLRSLGLQVTIDYHNRHFCRFLV